MQAVLTRKRSGCSASATSVEGSTFDRWLAGLGKFNDGTLSMKQRYFKLLGKQLFGSVSGAHFA